MRIDAKDKWQDVITKIDALKLGYKAFKKNMTNEIYLFGAGQFGISGLNYLQKNKYNVTCFIDNSPEKQGIKINGIPVVSSKDDIVKTSGVILITAKHAVIQIKTQLDNEVPNMSFDAWFAVENIKKYEHIRNNVLCDEASRRCLDGILLAMLTGNEKYVAEIAVKDQYFCLPQFVNTGKEYFVDAGAYVGDTVEKFIWANNGGFRHIYAFEPGKEQQKAFEKRKKRLVEEWALNPDSISIINSGLADKDGEAVIDPPVSLQSTILDTSGEIGSSNSVKVYSIDSFFKNIPVTFIKADIEGMEMLMLRGAEIVIKQNKPKMALSTYHEPDDLMEMVDIIKSYVPEYTMALRQHSPLLMETTLYCWIE